jgi:hypothetical protein
MKTTKRETTRIAFFSDLHGILPEIVACDLAIISGDVCPETTVLTQFRWLQSRFYPWLLGFSNAAWIAGNHDFVCEGFPEGVTNPSPNHVYLKDGGCTLCGLRLWGLPWTLPYGNYAFMKSEAGMVQRLEGIPDIDILISHGPPFGIGDIAYENVHAGSHALLHIIRKRKPLISCFGHIHGGRGIYYEGRTHIINASMCSDESCGITLIHPPIIVDLDKKGEVLAIKT